VYRCCGSRRAATHRDDAVSPSARQKCPEICAVQTFGAIVLRSGTAISPTQRSTRRLPARMGRNPATREPIQVAVSKTVTFRMAKELKTAVQS
jgi:hypothetical protein